MNSESPFIEPPFIEPPSIESPFIYFDAGYTLLHPYPSIGHHYARAAERYGARMAPERLEEAFRPAWREGRRRSLAQGRLPYGRTESEARDFWLGVIQEGFRIAGYEPIEDPQYYREVFDRFAQADCWEISPEAPKVFASLKRRGIPFGILSNWDARLRTILENIGWGDPFAAIVLSCDAGAEKPDAAIFRAAERAARRPPERLALIGDEVEADGHGARRAGWRQCLLPGKRGEAPPPELLAAASLSEAVEKVLA